MSGQITSFNTTCLYSAAGLVNRRSYIGLGNAGHRRRPVQANACDRRRSLYRNAAADAVQDMERGSFGGCVALCSKSDRNFWYCIYAGVRERS